MLLDFGLFCCKCVFLGGTSQFVFVARIHATYFTEGVPALATSCERLPAGQTPVCPSCSFYLAHINFYV